MKLPYWFSHAHFYRFACLLTGGFFVCFLLFALFVGQSRESHSTVLKSREIFQHRVQAEKKELTLEEERLEREEREENIRVSS